MTCERWLSHVPWADSTMACGEGNESADQEDIRCQGDPDSVPASDDPLGRAEKGKSATFICRSVAAGAARHSLSQTPCPGESERDGIAPCPAFKKRMDGSVLL
jgi:hypothetical protein